MARVLMVAPTCDGEDVGEAWIAYQWVQNLSKVHDLTVLTYHKRGHKPASLQLPRNVRVVEWVEPPLLGRAERLNSLMKPGYFPFYVRARRWIRAALDRGDRFDLAHQVSPVSLRFPSPLEGLGVPYLIGPVGGSLSNPPNFAISDDSAPWYVGLRRLDHIRLRRDPVLRRTFSGASCVVGIADYVAESLAPIPLQQFVVMADTGIEELPGLEHRSGRSGPIRLLQVGRLTRTKGAQESILALSLLPDLDVVLDIVGDGPDRGACERLVSNLGLSDRVRFHGAVPHERVDAFYRAADVFIFPSYREAGGIVVVEAMSYGLPLVVADRGGPGSATDDQCAFKVPVTTPDELAKGVAVAVRELVADENLRLSMGEAGRLRIEQSSLWESKISRMGDLYKEVIAGASGD